MEEGYGFDQFINFRKKKIQQLGFGSHKRSNGLLKAEVQNIHVLASKVWTFKRAHRKKRALKPMEDWAQYVNCPKNHGPQLFYANGSFRARSNVSFRLALNWGFFWKNDTTHVVELM